MDPAQPSDADLLVSNNEEMIDGTKPIDPVQHSSSCSSISTSEDELEDDEIAEIKSVPDYQSSEGNGENELEDEIAEIKSVPDDQSSEGNGEKNCAEKHQSGEYKSPEDWPREKVEKEEGDEDLGDYSELMKDLAKKNWERIDDFIGKNPNTLYASLREDSFTLFHEMISYDEDEPLRLMKKFLGMVSPADLDKTYASGSTPLCSAAYQGNTKAAKILWEFDKNLPHKKNNFGHYPIHCAAMGGNRETIEYLLQITKLKDPFTGESGVLLLEALIKSNFFDVALNLLEHHKELARDDYRFRRRILLTLAGKPKFFASGCRFGYWKSLIYQIIPVQKDVFDLREIVGGGDTENPSHSSSTKTASGFLPKMTATFGAWCKNIHIVFWNALIQLAPCIKGIHDTKLMHFQSVEIVRMICDGVKWNTAFETLKMPLLSAAKLGIYEIVIEILNFYSASLVFVDEDGNDIYMLSVLHRQEKLFRILSQKPGIKKAMESSVNKFNNNILHLAGRLVPSSEVPDAALQMQRELQWFKAVENCFSPLYQEQRNTSGKTPEEVFMEEHKELVKDGEKWLKDTARSCSVVVSLIITVVFAAAITVPGGQNSEGIPIFLKDVPFIVFITADALALFSSTTSLLMFLGILTSRYSQKDFLESLPRKLVIGLISMFFSIATLMVAFGATVYIVLYQPWKWVIIPVALLGCFPVTLFALLQYPLLIEIFLSTYTPSLFQPLKIGM